jgi:hypothetical protein
MQQNTAWEANKFAATREFPRILCNMKVRYHIHKSAPPLHILSTTYYSHITLYVTSPTTPGSLRWLLSLMIFDQTFCMFPTCPRASCNTYLVRPHLTRCTATTSSSLRFHEASTQKKVFFSHLTFKNLDHKGLITLPVLHNEFNMPILIMKWKITFVTYLL